MRRLTGVSHTAIIKGIREILNLKKLGYEGRVRKSGGGRMSLEHKDGRPISIRQWWSQLRRKQYTGDRELLIYAKSSVSNRIERLEILPAIACSCLPPKQA